MLGQLRQYLKSSMSSVQIPTTKILSVKFVTAALKNHYKSNSYPDASMILTHVSFRKQTFQFSKMLMIHTAILIPYFTAIL